MSTAHVVFTDHCAQLSGGEIALARMIDAFGPHLRTTVVLGERGPLEAELRAAGAEVRILEVPSRADIRKEDVGVRGLGVRLVVDWLTYVVRLRRLLRELRPDVVQTNSLKAAFYGGLAGRLAGAPVVWHLRDTLTPDYLPDSALRLVRIAGRVLPHRVVANSRATLRAWEELVGPRAARRTRGSVVHDVLPAGAFRSARSSETVRTISIVGRLAPWKGQDVFLRAFAEVSRTRPGLRAVVAGSAMFGEDDFAASLGDLVATLGLTGSVELRGFVADVPALLVDTDLLVHASVIPEPFGQVIVEGMAAGLPVIASDLGGPREIIRDQVDGLLVPAGDPHRLAAAMVSLIDDRALRDRLAREGRRRAEAYGPASLTTPVDALYRSLLSHQIPPREMQES